MLPPSYDGWSRLPVTGVVLRATPAAAHALFLRGLHRLASTPNPAPTDGSEDSPSYASDVHLRYTHIRSRSTPVWTVDVFCSYLLQEFP